MHHILRPLFALVVASLTHLACAAFPAETDVVVAGASSVAVSAALAAAEAGARVCLLSPRPYLGEDIAGTLRLEASDGDRWSHPLMAALWGAQEAPATNLTPMRIKKVFDEALLAARVQVRCWSVPCGLLKDANGTVSGITFRSRNGLESITARVVIDATRHSRLARQAGIPFEPLPPGPLTFRRRILAAAPPENPRVHVRTLPRSESVKISGRKTGFQNALDSFTATLYECEMKLPMKDGSALSFAEAEQLARDLTWVPSLVDAADILSCDAQPKPLRALPFLFVPEPSSLPGQALEAGRICGQKAALQALKRTPPKPLKPAPENLPILGECDVFVAGAGTGGAPAAIAAARAGMRTVVCDYAWKMGGVMTEGRIGKYWYGNRVGFTTEIDHAMPKTGWIFSESKAEWFRQECRKAGATILFGTMACGTVVEKGAVTGVVVALPDGTVGLYRCKTAIDSTGNADLAAFSGAKTEFIDDQELALQGATFANHGLGASYQNSDFAFFNDTDPDDLTWMSMHARRAAAGSWNQSQVPSSRERRRITGAYRVTSVDEMTGRTYPDVICIAKSNFDTHGQTIDPLFFLKIPPHDVKTVQLPYRALLPESLDGLLVTGLGMSAQRDAMPILRMQPDVQNQGYAAGLASAQAVRKNCSVRAIDVKALQQELILLGILPESVLSMPDNFPLPDATLREALKKLATPTEKDPYPGLETLASDPARALPLLRDAWTAAPPESEPRFRYALAAACLGDAMGASDILARVKATPWDKGWNYRGMGQFGRSVSDVDGWIFMLGNIRAKEAVPALLKKAKLLHNGSTYSHFRSISLALEQIGDPAAAPVLEELLRKPGIGGHALAPEDGLPGKLGGDGERTRCLRELCLARALYRLDDANGLGEATLRQYARDPRGAYAEHAQKILASKNPHSSMRNRKEQIANEK